MIRMPGKKNEMMVCEGPLTLKVLEHPREYQEDDRVFTIQVMAGEELPSDAFMIEGCTGTPVSSDPWVDYEVRRVHSNTAALMTIKS